MYSSIKKLSSIVTKARYLGSLILPSPLQVQVTISLYSDRIEIAELEATIYLDKVDKARIVKGSELPAQTILMAGVVGLVIDKDKSYVVVEIKPASTESPTAGGILLTFEEDVVANQFVKEIESKRNSLANAVA